MHPLLEHAVDKTVELLAEKPVELLTGLLLVAVTFLLFKATKDLARATNVLAQSTTEESRNRRIQATADAWMKIRPELELPDLTGASESAINAAREEVLPQLRKLEAFAELINAGVYDRETVNDISGSWFRQQFPGIKPIIEKAQKRNPDFYKELVSFALALEDMRSAPAKK